ncbi:histidinol-phosphate aminotransferase [Novimethylophilus kurashikiensis]|uniref:Histidinol-phosphate aminotransferase n=1 Tax=Novimethylophilus kurashikiensis TaxID=1825523 RepID=A0A2R5F8N2_9PROT|nr:hypothetical protein [Novimethylophilus kurashikiensis]GBG14557.1 histidinol-phosphate aminotransferase [Novimethylophilus kurashikiensis]
MTRKYEPLHLNVFDEARAHSSHKMKRLEELLRLHPVDSINPLPVFVEAQAIAAKRMQPMRDALANLVK